MNSLIQGQDKLQIRCLDTVALGPLEKSSATREICWFFTTKAGQLTKKKISACIDIFSPEKSLEEQQFKGTISMQPIYLIFSLYAVDMYILRNVKST